MEPKFKIGDEVMVLPIKPGAKPSNYWGSFVPDMQALRGNIFTIASCEESACQYYYHFKECTNRYNWVEEEFMSTKIGDTRIVGICPGAGWFADMDDDAQIYARYVENFLDENPDFLTEHDGYLVATGYPSFKQKDDLLWFLKALQEFVDKTKNDLDEVEYIGDVKILDYLYGGVSIGWYVWTDSSIDSYIKKLNPRLYSGCQYYDGDCTCPEFDTKEHLIAYLKALNKIINKKNDVNRLQKSKTRVERGKDYCGSTICGRRHKITIESKSLSYKEIFG